MTVDISVCIGGEAGQGIQTIGELVARVCQKAGFYLMAVNDFESRIRGGHSFFQIRISDRPVFAPNRDIHLLVALDPETRQRHARRLVGQGRVLMAPETSTSSSQDIFLPFREMALTVGSAILSNTVAAGAALALIGAPLALCREVVSNAFAGKGQALADQNGQALEAGYKAMADVDVSWRIPWKVSPPKGRLVDGAKAVALGALAGGCRLAAFYPMSPATGILTHLAAVSHRLALVVEQAEDEIAAVNMAIGASFAGARAMTATSGGGFCLMTEGLGLAAMTETPIVIIDAQRPGPATGLPTRTAQGDLLFAIHASQDDFPRFVFAPGSAREAFEITARAFELTEKYQVPAIILVDQFLTDSLFILPPPTAPDALSVYTVNDSEMLDPAAYQRFAFTESGVSPRALPCQGHARVVVCSDEHRPDGHISEDADNRKRMVDKRNAKRNAMAAEMNPPNAYFGESRNLLVCWGSSLGAVQEAVDLLREKGLDVGCIHFSHLWPFPAAPAARSLGQNRRLFMIEASSAAQLDRLIRQETGLEVAGRVLRYDGRPFYPRQIAEAIETQVRAHD
jgi:2-oxoglutarate ferredoxin oxidoreductase subunit alpha